MAVAIALPTLGLSEDESETLGYLRARLQYVRGVNEIKQQYYDGTHWPRQLDISIPPQLKDLETVMGWPSTVVNALGERLDFLEWTSTGDSMGLDEIYADNQLEVESGQINIESLTNGVGFAIVGRGDVDEPPVLITAESASTTTGEYDRRRRRLVSAISQTLDDRGLLKLETLYLPDVTIRMESDPKTGRSTIVDRDRHGLHRVPVVRFVNLERPSDIMGRSEITRAVRYLTDAAQRTLLGMEVNREFYTAPQRAALGATPEQFGVKEDDPDWKKKQAGWSAMMGRFNIVPATEDGTLPQMMQFNPSPPTPYIEQIRAYALWLASEAGVPAASLGVHTDNPSSADAIIREERRLISRAEFRQRAFSRAYLEVASLALTWRDGTAPDRDAMRKISVKWQDPATPTRAAAADEATKLVGAGVLPADSSVTYDRIGLSQQDQKRLAADKRRAGMATLLSRLPQPAPAPVGTDADNV
ncbi:phage portal protein [Nocardia vulneris]|uniref:phage portal protein n=1 Tax=Nocardia vulneris TaxID=1141657 RepID=UPI0006898E62|nr:phage portal protein [Nocardia vulneris]